MSTNEIIIPISNPLFLPRQASDNCIICLDNDGFILKNHHCPCVYHYHEKCMKATLTPTKCVICKKEVRFAEPSELSTIVNCICSYSFICIFIIIIALIIIFEWY